jgi:hypothetical protein
LFRAKGEVENATRLAVRQPETGAINQSLTKTADL